MAIEKRLIDVWDLIEWLDNFDRENTLRILRGKKAKLLNSHAIKNMIVTVPRVDVVEVVHGRWDHNGNCSACNKNIYDDIDADMWACYEPPYCPNCGARMDLED